VRAFRRFAKSWRGPQSEKVHFQSPQGKALCWAEFSRDLTQAAIDKLVRPAELGRVYEA